VKKLLSLALSASLLLALSACGTPAPIPNPSLVLGEKYLADLDYEQALLQFDQAIEIDPKNPRGHLGKADALLHLDRQDDAAATLADGAKVVPKDQRGALQNAQAGVETSSEDGYIGIAAAYEALSFVDVALSMLQRVTQEFPTTQRILQALLDLGSRLGIDVVLPSTPLEDVVVGEEFAFKGRKYSFFNNEIENWAAAQDYCESLGGQLAVINSQELNDYLYNAMRSLGIESAYFGYTDREEEGVWAWVDGTQVSYENWHMGEPNDEHGGEDYAMYYGEFGDSTWNDGDFGLHTGAGTVFICEWSNGIM